MTSSEKKSFLTAKVLVVMLLVAIIYVTYEFYNLRADTRKPNRVQLHPYDYILEVDGTDSISVYTIYNQDHSVVGSFTSSHCDSLDVIIMEDNL